MSFLPVKENECWLGQGEKKREREERVELEKLDNELMIFIIDSTHLLATGFYLTNFCVSFVVKICTLDQVMRYN